MPLATSRSVPYLYVKAYLLGSLISIFAAAPLSRRIPPSQYAKWEQLRKRGEERARIARMQIGLGTVFHPDRRDAASANKIETVQGLASSELKTRLVPFSRPSSAASEALPPSVFSVEGNPTVQGSLVETPTDSLLKTSRLQKLAGRWNRRFRELVEIRKLMQRDMKDKVTYPELDWDASVRVSHATHPAELAFLAARKDHIASTGSLARFLQLSKEEAALLHPDDIPVLAIGGSGGGYRAKLGFTAFLETLERRDAWDVASYTAGVSGSCWTLAALYTIASMSPSKLLAHYRLVAAENLHPLSRQAIDVVARSKRGTYFLLAPLLRKVGSGVVGVGVMDLYATMSNCYQLLTRSKHAPARLSRATFQFSKVFERAGLARGDAPMPILTAVRVVHQPASNTIPNTSAQCSGTSRETLQQRGGKTNTGYHWFEMSPLEFGSADAGAWIPTWSFGRSFRSGKSLAALPEISLSLVVGMCTSAPAGPLTGYISALLASLPTGTLMATMLFRINNFVKMKRWRRRWGNPIRAADEPNPFYGLGSHEGTGVPGEEGSLEWEAAGRIKLMDAGLSNNLPSHVFATPNRQADVIMCFDASSDVQASTGVERIHEFGAARGLQLTARDELAELSPYPLDEKGRVDSRGQRQLKHLTAAEVKQRYGDRYAQILDGRKIGEKTGDEVDMNLLYCPLLPHAVRPDFDPSRATWSTSYNLVWRPEQVDTIVATATANAEECIEALRGVMREAWMRKRAKRLRHENSRRHL